MALVLSGCNKFRHLTHTYVYVAARQVYLHDRVAAVSNRVGMVTNGETLEVVERGRRFIRVRTPKGEVGWLEEHAVIDDKLYAQFQDLAKQHAQDPVVATGQLRDDLYMHILPGRATDHFLLIPGNAKVQLLVRGSVPKTAAPGMPALSAPKPKSPASTGTPNAGATAGSKGSAAPAKATPVVPAAKPPAPAAPAAAATADESTDEPTLPQPAVPMEDWWLIRDQQGHTGWLLANRLDVDIPDEVGAYAEGQRMVAAYPIAKVTDYGAEAAKAAHEKHEALIAEIKQAKRKGTKPHPKPEPEPDAADAPPAAAPVGKEFTEYVTVLAPPRGGLPYDFDQLRVFTWSLNHHRYETGFRLHGVQGYLPVRLSQETINGQTYPVFSFQIASGPEVSIDPTTGVAKPVAPRTVAFRLEGNLVKRTGQDQNPIVLAHDPVEAAKLKAAKNKKKH